MCVLSNNSPKKISIYIAQENAPDHVVKILDFIKEVIREFNVTVKKLRNSTIIAIQDKKITNQDQPLRFITLNIFISPKSYAMNLYHQKNGTKNQKHVYEIKVKGNYELTMLKTNLEKLIRGKDLTIRPAFYPF